jgi:Tfp pilus assembly protein PilX
LETYVGTQPEGPYKQAIAEQKMERELAVAEKQREVANAKKRPETRNAECQTDPPKEEDADIVDISGIQVETYEDFLAIQGKTWSAESFGATKVVVGNPIKENLENGQVRSGQVK